MAYTITVTCSTGIDYCAWYQYSSSSSLIDQGTFRGTKSWSAGSGYIRLFPARLSGYSHPIIFYRTYPTQYTQYITNSDGSDGDRDIWFTANKSGRVEAGAPPAPTTYTISYDANGGSGAPSAQTKTHGVNLTLSSTKPSRTGYDFLYWQDQGTDYSIWHPGDSLDRDRDTTLKAIWQRKTYTVSYNANGGTGAPAAQTKYYGENLILTTDEPTRAGYNFINWFDGTDYYSPGGVYAANSPTTLYAQWNRKKYTITFNANGGSGAPSPQIKEHDITLTLSSVKPTWAGHIFVNWFDGTDYYDPGGSYTANSPANLYAQWKNACDLFYWHGSASADSAKFASGQPVKDALTAAAWNRAIDKVNEIRELLGQSATTIPKVSSGAQITAVAFNQLRTAIGSTTGAGTVPGAVSKGNAIVTSLFVGSGSLREALNTAINAYNNS